MLLPSLLMHQKAVCFSSFAARSTWAFSAGVIELGILSYFSDVSLLDVMSEDVAECGLNACT